MINIHGTLSILGSFFLLSTDFQVSATYSVELYSAGYSYFFRPSVDIAVNNSAITGNATYNLVVDTGSSFLFLNRPYDPLMFSSAAAAAPYSGDYASSSCLYLLVDNTLANFTGASPNPKECLASVSDQSAVMTLGGEPALAAHVAVKLSNRFLSGALGMNY